MSGEEIHEEPVRYPPVHVDLSDFPSYLGSPPASPFHGFDSEEMLPGRLVINTDTVDGEEVFTSIRREKGRGRPKGRQQLHDPDSILLGRRKEQSPSSTGVSAKTERSVHVTPKENLGGTGSRPLMYLIGQPPTKLRFAKLPTTGAILGRYLSLLENTSASEAAAMAREELKAVWLHHFAARLVEGKELGIEEKGEEKKKIIKQDRFIDEKIVKI